MPTMTVVARSFKIFAGHTSVRSDWLTPAISAARVKIDGVSLSFRYRGSK